MADFVIVIATAAALAAPTATGSAAPTPATPSAKSSVPLTAPTVGFRTYPDVASCEQATAILVAPPNARLVCLPAGPMAGEMASAY